MAVVTLTDKRVSNMPVPRAKVKPDGTTVPSRSELWDKLVPGFSLRVTSNGVQTWAVKVGAWVDSPDGRKRKQQRVKLGHPRASDGTPVLTLAQARAKAREVKQLAAEGKPLTPNDAGHVALAKADTFGTLAADYLNHLAKNERPSTAKEARRVLKRTRTLRHGVIGTSPASRAMRCAHCATASPIAVLRSKATAR